MIKVIADQNLYKLEEFLPDEIDLTTYDPNHGLPDVSGFEALLLRTVSKLNPTTLPTIPSSLKFVGTGSSGIDHVDVEYLTKNKIEFADAHGNNARAVAEYVMTALLLFREDKGKVLTEFTYGIIGVGKAGTAVAELFEEFGLKYVLYDPPRAEIEPEFISANINDILECDILTFHVSYSTSGKYSTHYWLDEEKISGRNFELIINASRGAVIEETAISKAIESGSIKNIVIDVWENEPDFNIDFADLAFIATPHIAGYSEQSKLNASSMVCEKLCRYFDLKYPVTNDLYTDKELKPADLNYSLKELLFRLHPIKEYDADLRDLINRPNKATLFSKLRTDRPYRFEYGFIKLDNRFLARYEDLRKLGTSSH